MTKKIAPFQEKGRDFLASRKVAYLGDQMRLGKSCQAIQAADKLKAKRILVICPASVKITWAREFEKWSCTDRSVQIVSGTKAEIDPNADLVIINYDILWRPIIKEQLVKLSFAVGICDEAHYLAGKDSKRTKALLCSKNRTPILSKCIYKWFLSGTPILNRPREFYPILASCAPHVIDPYKSYRAYTTRYCGGYWDGIQWVDNGATNKEELNYKLHQGFMLRRLRKDVMDEIPQDIQMISIEPNSKTKRLIGQQFSWAKEDADYQKLELDDEMATVRRELGMAKLGEAKSHIDYILGMEDKLVVFGYHRELIGELKKKLKKYNPVVLQGGMSAEKKQEAVDTFTNDKKCRVFIGQMVAAGVGLDLSAANNILFVEPDWVPGTMEQPMDRCSGWNQEKQVFIQIMVYADSLEEHMMRTAITKKNNIEETIEDLDIFK